MPARRAVAIPATFPTTHCGTGGDKPRPYGKSESVSVGAGFIARPWGSRDFHKASPQRYPVRAAKGSPVKGSWHGALRHD